MKPTSKRTARSQTASPRPMSRASVVAAGAALLALPALGSLSFAAPPSSEAKPAAAQQTRENAQASGETRTVTDAAIRDVLIARLRKDDAVKADSITVSVSGGIVTLEGQVGNLLAKQRAEAHAGVLRGVTDVKNSLKVPARPGVGDDALEADVHGALHANVATESFEIDAVADDGVIRLVGSVDSWQERQLAERLASGVRGVIEVDNQLLVEQMENRPDEEVRLDIESALRWDVLIDDGMIDVKVNQGQVTLSGMVGSFNEKQRALARAHVAGAKTIDVSSLEVKQIARNEMIVSGAEQPPAAGDVQRAVRAALRLDPQVRSSDVAVEIASGQATLTGSVASMAAKQAAAEIARGTLGVESVDNQLRVSTKEAPDDQQIAKQVEAAFIRDPYVDRYQLTAKVEDGTVYLNGLVTSWFEKARAGSAVAGIKGVRAIDNNIRVENATVRANVDPRLGDGWYTYDFDWYQYEPPARTASTDGRIEGDVQEQLWWNPYVDEQQVTVTVQDGVATLSGQVTSHHEASVARQAALQAGAIDVVDKLQVRRNADPQVLQNKVQRNETAPSQPRAEEQPKR